LHYRLLVFILVFFFSWTGLKAQRDSISILKNQSRLADTTQIRKTTGLGIDTIPQISIKKAFDTIPSRKTVKISETGLEDRVKFGAVDTQWIDKKTQTVYLKGKAYVNYQDKSIKADYIELQLQKKLAEARRLPDMPGSEKAIFTDGGNEYAYNALKYNFETEKGLVMDAVMKEGEFIIHGARTKYLKDSTDNRKGAIINNANGLVTTCQHDEPHFGIRAKKMKLVSDRLAVFGPSNLELGGVPTPYLSVFTPWLKEKVRASYSLRITSSIRAHWALASSALDGIFRSVIMCMSNLRLTCIREERMPSMRIQATGRDTNTRGPSG